MSIAVFDSGVGGISVLKSLVEVMPNEDFISVSYTHLRAHETDSYLVCRLLLEKKKKL